MTPGCSRLRKEEACTASPTTDGARHARRFGLPIRVHDLRHTFGERAADAGIPLDIRRSLLGHEHRDITLHYSSPGLARLLEEAERIARPSPGLSVAHCAEISHNQAGNAA
ncbi:MAG: site-specific integrase [Sphingobacterium sp.]|nr:site-specific integrase [Sphingobacterium sp.]